MTTLKSPFHSTGCALIIGINDYSAFDSTGARNLKGSVNDAVSVAQLCSDLGMAPEDIHVVCSESDGEGLDQLRVERIKDTSQSGIYAQIEWLRQKLEAGGREGLLWYSGHGAHLADKGLLLCPSDTTADLSNTIPFRGLREKLGPDAARHLAVVLDCCHGGSIVDRLGRTSTTLGGDPVPEHLAGDEMEIGAIVLTACALGELTQQSVFASHWHGAFTWAFLSVLDQWQKVQQGGNVRLDVTYRELMKKTTVLLDALEFEGTPQIYPRSAGGLAVLQRGYETLATSKTPDANRPTVQMDTGSKGYQWYKLTSGDTLIAYVLSVGGTATTAGTSTNFPANTEYWFMQTTTAPSTSLTVTKLSTMPTASISFGYQSFTMAQNPTTWNDSRTPSGSAGNSGTAPPTPPTFISGAIGLTWGLSYGGTAQVWGGSLTWYSTGTSNNLFSGSTTSTTLTVTNTPAAPTWHSVDVFVY
jgi:hypothetical protein